jgi:hypothetical protein
MLSVSTLCGYRQGPRTHPLTARALVPFFAGRVPVLPGDRYQAWFAFIVDEGGGVVVL